MLLPLVSLPAAGVRVAVQWILSLELRLLRVPLAAVKSDRLKPLTASLNVMCTRDEPPAFNAGLSTTMVAVGRTVSTV